MSNDKIAKVVNVYETTDYDKFQLIVGNRQTDKGHVRSLQKSILDHGNLTIDDPIEVDQDFNVFDGQHRLAALKALGMPVYYVFREHPTVQSIRIANSNRKNWNWQDYATSYRDELNNQHYAQFLELFEEFKYNFRILLTYCGENAHSGRTEANSALRKFIDGDFVMKDYDKTYEQLTQYQELSEAAKIHNREFAIASYRFMQNSTYNHAKMLDKIRAHRTALANCYLTLDYLYTLQDIWRA